MPKHFGKVPKSKPKAGGKGKTTSPGQRSSGTQRTVPKTGGRKKKR